MGNLPDQQPEQSDDERNRECLRYSGKVLRTLPE